MEPVLQCSVGIFFFLFLHSNSPVRRSRLSELVLAWTDCSPAAARKILQSSLLMSWTCCGPGTRRSSTISWTGQITKTLLWSFLLWQTPWTYQRESFRTEYLVEWWVRSIHPSISSWVRWGCARETWLALIMWNGGQVWIVVHWTRWFGISLFIWWPASPPPPLATPPHHSDLLLHPTMQRRLPALQLDIAAASLLSSQMLLLPERLLPESHDHSWTYCSQISK